MKLSARVQSLTSSPIRKLSPYADAAKATGKKIYHLNIGQPDIKTPAQFMESIRSYDDQVIAYGNSKGEGFLIEAIRKYYAEKFYCRRYFYYQRRQRSFAFCCDGLV